MALKSIVARLRRALAVPLDAALGYFAALCLQVLRRFNRRRMADFLGAASRRIGPYLPEHRTGRANLIAAFPDKTPAEIEAILSGVWDNLGRFVADFAHLDRLTVRDPAAPGASDIEYDEETLKRFEALRDSGKPALFFAAHLANWEIPPLVAHRYGIDATVLYRRPNLPGVADAVVAMRAGCMGTLVPSGLNAPLLLARALEKNGVAGMLIDQHDRRGTAGEFFGLPVLTGSLLARLARQIQCPIHGVRVIRLPDNRFRVQLTDAITPARSSDGQIDIAETMQVVNNIVEGWVREYPEQWLWLHRRWRPEKSNTRKGSRLG
jgi:KDO2-lipid IV(A) lauroyltransferase